MKGISATVRCGAGGAVKRAAVRCGAVKRATVRCGAVKRTAVRGAIGIARGERCNF